MERRGRGPASAIAIIALVIAIVALVIAWMAYDRTGANLEQRIQEAAQDASESIQQGVQEGADAIDAGPDGIDNDDTDVNRGTQ